MSRHNVKVGHRVTEHRRATKQNDTDEESELAELEEISPEEITVAIFCALPYESVAVRYSFDQEFECRLQTIGPKRYVYAFGRIRDHKIVLARPNQMGPVNAAHCATTVSQQFPNVRFALMVGIGAGVPSLPKWDIRLGDIVVSIPQDGHPGVLQYDFGKYELDGEFILKGSFDKPPPILRSADGSLEEDEIMSKSPLRRILKRIIKKPGYSCPKLEDVLFGRNFHHKKGDDCSGCEANPEKEVVERPKRDINLGPIVHRGLILSGSGVIKNPEFRDHLAGNISGPICFEMEAAGIMDNIPCLVIRGICDYADSHKNDRWHHYAAAAAAAYCKAILLKVYGEDVQNTISMKEAIDKLNESINEVSKNVETLKHNAIRTDKILVETEQEKILQWLIPINYGPQQTDFLSRRQNGTGEWFLKSEEYRSWLNGSKQTLFCPGIPGAGKTILTSAVIDNLHENFQNELSIGIAYIYFNFRQKDEQAITSLLASLLKQLAQGQSSIPESLQQLYDKHNTRRTRPLHDEILRVLRSVTILYSRVFIILDALDECQTSGDCLAMFLSEVFDLQNSAGINILATSRHIPEIVAKFEHCKVVEIRASREDVRRYIEGNTQQLRPFIHRDLKLKGEVTDTISEAVDGMFLLAQIYLASLDDKLTTKAVKNSLREFLHQDQRLGDGKSLEVLNNAYGHAMERINGQKPGLRQLAIRVLSWITCAKRPLTKSEVQVALAVEVNKLELDEDNLIQVEDMVSVCAGLVTVDEESSIIRLVHYTTQIYFEKTQGKWFPEAQLQITITCLTYLSFHAFESGCSTDDKEFEDRIRKNPLYDYAAHNWGHHARETYNCSQIQSFCQSKALVEASSQSLFIKSSYRYRRYSQEFPRKINGLHLAAYFGIGDTVQQLLGSQDYEKKDAYGRTPLSYAAQYGHEAVVRLLLTNGADINTKQNFGRTPLSYAAQYGHEAVLQLLLEQGAHIDIKSNSGQTPLVYAAQSGHQAIVRQMLVQGVDVDITDNLKRTSLSHAAQYGCESVVEVLLLNGANVNTSDNFGRTPLSYAAQYSRGTVVQLFLDKGADIDTEDYFDRSPLSYAAQYGHNNVMHLLHSNGADINSKDKLGRTPLSYAAQYGQEVVVKLLLAKGINIYTRDETGRTPLSYAAHHGHEVVMQLLLDNGADVDAADEFCRTPLSYAAQYGDEVVIQVLLANGAYVDTGNESSRTPLSYAAHYGHTAVTKLLLANGASVDTRDEYGRTSLLYAARHGQSTVIELLLVSGADINIRDESDQTPLLYAAQYGHEAVVHTLLTNGADVDTKDDFGQTPLSYAAQYGHEAVAKLLLDKGADIDNRDKSSQTPLSHAAVYGYEAVLKLLLSKGADIHTKDESAQTPLSYAVQYGHKDVIHILLVNGADVNTEDELGRTPLFYVARHNHMAIMQLLLANGANVDTKNGSGRTPLSYAAENWDVNVVGLLLTKGADVNTEDESVRTPLSYAAQHGGKGIMELLIAKGANVNCRDKFGRTPLSYAAQYGHAAVITLLLAKAAVIDIENNFGQTPLMYASQYGHDAVVQLLLGNSLSIDVRDDESHISVSRVI